MTVKERVRISTEVIEKAYEEVMEREKKGFKRGELKPFLMETADKYEISWFSLKNKLYREREIAKMQDEKKQQDEKKKQKKKKEVESKKVEQLTMEETPQQKTEKQDEVEVKLKEESTKPKRPKHIENPYSAFIDIDKNIEEASKRPATERLMPKDIYKIGQLVRVRVDNIQAYGAFCEIMDGRGFNSLCHISEMVNGYINKVTEFVDIGDIIEGAKIVMIDDRRINVSFKHLHMPKKQRTLSDLESSSLESDSLESSSSTGELPMKAENPPVNVVGEKFGNLKDKLMERVVVTTGNNVEEIDEIFAQELLNESQESIIKKYEKDIEYMTTYLQDELGVLTTPAKLELAKIIEEQGVFNTTRGILSAQKDFKADIGLLFMQMIKSKIGDYL